MDYGQIADYQELMRLIRQPARIIKMCKVQSVDTNLAVCVCEDITGSEADWPKVHLTATHEDADTPGIIVVPKVGSIVLIGQIDGVELWFVCAFSEIDGVIVRGPNGFSMVLNDQGNIALNGGQNGGLVNLPTLLTELEKLNTRVEAIATTLTSWPVLAQDGGLALQTAANTALSPLPSADFSPGPLTDDKITH